jgi:hypothetical protein
MLRTHAKKAGAIRPFFVVPSQIPDFVVLSEAKDLLSASVIQNSARAMPGTTTHPASTAIHTAAIAIAISAIHVSAVPQ